MADGGRDAAAEGVAAEGVAAEGDPSEHWAAVRLTEARQVAALIDRDPEEWPAGLGVAAGYRRLRANAPPGAALEYLVHALPRLEAIAWAARVVRDAGGADDRGPRERQAIDAARRWLAERTDSHRRAARAAAARLRRPGAEYQLCMAVFYSGGSITDPGLPPIIPPEEAVARYALGAIRAVAYAGNDPAAVFAAALGLGERVAMRGLEAL